ncbi:MAG: hypothetical protein NVV59_05200 [Chitinophagaceae bacterium]|nr:hypothetical protein [Chitinophagaceae bacterium]
MKLSLIYTGLAVLVLSSCSTAYRAGQTPDDVYYSPARETDSYVVVDRRQDRYNDRYNDYDVDRYYEDRFLRMRVMNRGLWSSLDYYYANPYAFSPYNYYHSWNDPWNSYWAWNSFYNPYFNSYYGLGGWNSWAGGGWGGWGHGGIIVGGGSKPVTRPSRALVFNPGSYLPNNQQSTSRGPNRYTPGSIGGSRYNNSNSAGYNSGRVSNNNSSYQPSRNNNTPSRSYTPSSSSGSSRSSGNSSSSSSGGGVSRPKR